MTLKGSEVELKRSINKKKGEGRKEEKTHAKIDREGLQTSGVERIDVGFLCFGCQKKKRMNGRPFYFDGFVI